MQSFTNSADFANVARALILDPNYFRDRDGYIPLIVESISKRPHLGTYIGDTESRRPHIDAAATCTQVERDSNDVYSLHI